MTALVAVFAIGIDSRVFTLGLRLVAWPTGLGTAILFDRRRHQSADPDGVGAAAAVTALTATSFGLFVLLWAPVAEELFYRGYVYTSLKQHLPLWLPPGTFPSPGASACAHVIHSMPLARLSVAGVVWPAAC